MNEPSKLSLSGRMKFLTRDAVIYGIGGALNKMFALITFPLLARHFSVQDYGLIDLLNTYLNLLGILLIFGQDSAIARFFFEDTDTEYRRQVISQSFALQFTIIACILPILWFNTAPIAKLMSAGGEVDVFIKILILQIPFMVLSGFSQNLLKWMFKKWHFLLLSFGSAIVSVISLVVGITFFDFGLVELFTVYLGIRVLFGLIGLWFVRQWFTWPSGWDRLHEMLPFAIPFGIICALSAVVPVMERSMVQWLLGSVELGLFAAGAKVAMLIGLPINAFQVAWQPFALSIFKEADAAASYRLVLNILSVLVFCLVLGLTAIAEPVVRILGSARYEGAAVVVFALCMGKAIEAIGGITEIGITLSKKSYLKLYGYGTMVIVAATAIPLLAMVFGLVGVAWGSMTAMLAKTVIETWLAQRVYPLAWSFRGPVLLGMATLAFGIVHQLTFGRFEVAGLSLVPLFGIVAILASGWLVLFSSDGRARILNMIRLKWTG